MKGEKREDSSIPIVFYLRNIEEVKAGAYIANPGEQEFSAKLASVKMGA